MVNRVEPQPQWGLRKGFRSHKGGPTRAPLISGVMSSPNREASAIVQDAWAKTSCGGGIPSEAESDVWFLLFIVKHRELSYLVGVLKQSAKNHPTVDLAKNEGFDDSYVTLWSPQNVKLLRIRFPSSA